MTIEAQPITTRGPYPYSHPMRGADENPAAHGGCCWIDERPDGSYRMRNTNGSHEEVGTWFAPETEVAS